MDRPLDEKVEPLFRKVIARNQGESEFHQAVREVLESLGPVLVKHPEFGEHKIIQRICEPERQIILRVPWRDDRGEVQINRGFRAGNYINGATLPASSKWPVPWWRSAWCKREGSRPRLPKASRVIGTLLTAA